MSDLLRHPLRRHPACPASPAGRIDTLAALDAAGNLEVVFRAYFAPASLRIPAARPPGAADGLWQHTCCEAFVAESGTAYREFNFSPSGQWASYRFDRYRARDETFAAGAAPTIAFQALADGFELRAMLPPALLPDHAPLSLGLTAVIELADGSKHYWALTHAGEQPDFHLPQSFTLTLPVHTP